MSTTQGAVFGTAVELANHCLCALTKIGNEKTAVDSTLPEAALSARKIRTVSSDRDRIHPTKHSSLELDSESEAGQQHPDGGMYDAPDLRPTKQNAQQAHAPLVVSEAARLRQATQALRVWRNDVALAGLRSNNTHWEIWRMLLGFLVELGTLLKMRPLLEYLDAFSLQGLQQAIEMAKETSVRVKQSHAVAWWALPESDDDSSDDEHESAGDDGDLIDEIAHKVDCLVDLAPAVLDEGKLAESIRVRQNGTNLRATGLNIDSSLHEAESAHVSWQQVEANEQPHETSLQDTGILKPAVGEEGVMTAAMKPGMPRKQSPGKLSYSTDVRTKTGCATCRQRKTICDERRPGCLACERNNVVCEGYEPKQSWKDDQKPSSELLSEPSFKEHAKSRDSGYYSTRSGSIGPNSDWNATSDSQIPRVISLAMANTRPENRPPWSFHEEETGSVCPVQACGRVVRDLEAHLLTHRVERPQKCPVPTCEYHTKGFARKYDSDRHTLTHYKGTMTCGFCLDERPFAEKTFAHVDRFKRHLVAVHGVEQLVPGVEKYGGKKPSKATSDQGRPISGACSSCGGSFTDAQPFYDHLSLCILAIVRQDAIEKPDRPELLPSHFEEEVVSDISANHEATPSDVDQLGSALSTQTTMPVLKPDPERLSDPASAAGEADRKSPASATYRHKCPHCSTSFMRHHNLKSHLLTHSQEKPYGCQTCNARFRRLRDLKRHMKLHTVDKPHVCATCGRRFMREDALIRHAKGPGGCAGRRNTGEEDDYSSGVFDDLDDPLSSKTVASEDLRSGTASIEACPQPECEYHIKGYPAGFDVSRHELLHHPEGSFSCIECPEGHDLILDGLEACRSHLISVHGVDETQVLPGSVPLFSRLLGNLSKFRGLCSACDKQFASPEVMLHHLDDSCLVASKPSWPKATKFSSSRDLAALDRWPDKSLLLEDTVSDEYRQDVLLSVLPAPYNKAGQNHKNDRFDKKPSHYTPYQRIPTNADSENADPHTGQSTHIPTAKRSSSPPWTPAEEQRLSDLRDEGCSWSEIARSFPARTEASVKKHWYKDLHPSDEHGETPADFQFVTAEHPGKLKDSSQMRANRQIALQSYLQRGARIPTAAATEAIHAMEIARNVEHQDSRAQDTPGSEPEASKAIAPPSPAESEIVPMTQDRRPEIH